MAKREQQSNIELLRILAIAGALIPANYFVILYCVVYMLSPYINIMLDSVVLIYMGCWAAYMVYHKITEPIYKVLSSKIKLPLIDTEC